MVIETKYPCYLYWSRLIILSETVSMKYVLEILIFCITYIKKFDAAIWGFHFFKKIMETEGKKSFIMPRTYMLIK